LSTLRRARPFLLATAWAFGPGNAWAQAIGPATTPAPVAPAPAPRTAPAPAVLTPSLRVGVFAQESWNDNGAVLYGPPTDVFLERFGAGFTYVRPTPRSRLALAGRGAGVMYHGMDGHDRFNYAGAGDWTRQLESHTTLALDDSIVSTYSQGPQTLTDVGLVYPFVLSRSNHAGGSVAHDFSKRTSATVDVRHDWVNFAGDPTLVGGTALGAGARVNRQLGDRTSGWVGYRYSDNRAQARHWIGNAGAVGVSHALDSAWTLTGDAGLAHFQYAQNARWSAVGGVGVAGRFRRDAVTLQYTHTVDQAFGYAQLRAADSARGWYGRTLGRDVSAFAMGIYSHGRDPFGGPFVYETGAATAGLTYDPTRSLGLALDYTWRYRRLGSGLGVGSHGLNAAVTYGWNVF
jgi:hypothetical protein